MAKQRRSGAEGGGGFERIKKPGGGRRERSARSPRDNRNRSEGEGDRRVVHGNSGPGYGFHDPIFNATPVSGAAKGAEVQDPTIVRRAEPTIPLAGGSGEPHEKKKGKEKGKKLSVLQQKEAELRERLVRDLLSHPESFFGEKRPKGSVAVLDGVRVGLTEMYRDPSSGEVNREVVDARGKSIFKEAVVEARRRITASSEQKGDMPPESGGGKPADAPKPSGKPDDRREPRPADRSEKPDRKPEELPDWIAAFKKENQDLWQDLARSYKVIREVRLQIERLRQQAPQRLIEIRDRLLADIERYRERIKNNFIAKQQPVTNAERSCSKIVVALQREITASVASGIAEAREHRVDPVLFEFISHKLELYRMLYAAEKKNPGDEEVDRLQQEVYGYFAGRGQLTNEEIQAISDTTKMTGDRLAQELRDRKIQTAQRSAALVVGYVKSLVKAEIERERSEARENAARENYAYPANVYDVDRYAPVAGPKKDITARDAQEKLQQQIRAKAELNIIASTHFGPDNRELRDAELAAALGKAEEQLRALGVTDSEIAHIRKTGGDLYDKRTVHERQTLALAHYSAGREVLLSMPQGPEATRSPVEFDPAELTPLLNQLYEAEYDRRHADRGALSAASEGLLYALQNLQAFYRQHGMTPEEAEARVRQEHEIPVRSNQNLDEIVKELRKPSEGRMRRDTVIVEAPLVGSRDRGKDARRRRLEEELFSLLVEYYRARGKQQGRKDAAPPELAKRMSAVVAEGETKHNELTALLERDSMSKEEIDRVHGDIVARAEAAAAEPETPAAPPAAPEAPSAPEMNKEQLFKRAQGALIEKLQENLRGGYRGARPELTPDEVEILIKGDLILMKEEIAVLEQEIKEGLDKS